MTLAARESGVSTGDGSGLEFIASSRSPSDAASTVKPAKICNRGMIESAGGKRSQELQSERDRRSQRNPTAGAESRKGKLLSKPSMNANKDSGCNQYCPGMLQIRAQTRAGDGILQWINTENGMPVRKHDLPLNFATCVFAGLAVLLFSG
jgi:hypothetical protein